MKAENTAKITELTKKVEELSIELDLLKSKDYAEEVAEAERLQNQLLKAQQANDLVRHFYVTFLIE